MSRYEPNPVVEKYMAANERGRIETSLDTEIMYQIEKSYMQRLIPATGRRAVIDVGGGPGRYAVDAAKMGADVLLVDITPKHLEQARALAEEQGVTGRFLGFEAMDALGILKFGESRFDFALCLGMLNYLLDKDIYLLKAIRKVLVPEAYLLLSVMGLYGAIRHAWSAGRLEDAAYRAQEMDVIKTGINDFKKPARKFYTAEQLRGLVVDAGFTVVEMASTPTVANSLGIGRPESKEALEHILAVEKQCCSLPGLLDIGQHIIVVARA